MGTAAHTEFLMSVVLKSIESSVAQTDSTVRRSLRTSLNYELLIINYELHWSSYEFSRLPTYLIKITVLFIQQ